MLFTTLTLLLAQFGNAPEVTGRIDGQCLYPEAVQERAQGTMLVTCSEVVVEEGVIAFGLRGWETQVRFEGAFNGDRLTVHQVVTRHGDRVEEARGLCQLYYSNDELSTIACTAVAGSRSYAANFIVSRI